MNVLLIFFFTGLITCNNQEYHLFKKGSKKESIFPKYKLFPIGNSLSNKEIEVLRNQLNVYIDSIEIIKHKPIPQWCRNKVKTRYRADSIISWIHKELDNKQVVIGLTTHDLSTTKGSFEDWGIMGLAFKPGYSAVASSYRLKNKKLFWKIVIHELGHTTGLSHCPNKLCFMRNANGGDPTAEETGFCKQCAAHLRKNGWKI
jgi:archaemetzincin